LTKIFLFGIWLGALVLFAVRTVHKRVVARQVLRESLAASDTVLHAEPGCGGF
jgi:hypothetical protein